MACRKDGKGRVLRKGEGYRKGDGRYSYVYIDPLGKKRTIYAKSLVKLREREEQLQRDQLDGLDVYVAGKADVNFLFDRYISTKTELRSTTYSNYLYTWGIRVNFSPCVMTWAVLAKVVFCHSQRVWRIVNVDSKVIISI
jgi:integrase